MIRLFLGKVQRFVRHRLFRGGTKAPSSKLVHRQFVKSDHEREVAAVLAGQRKYLAMEQEGAASSFQLRRNIHRLEKGLIMRPRRDIFATDYIGATVEAFLKSEALPDHDRAEIAWASDVLALYFASTDRSEPSIAGALARWETRGGSTCRSGDQVPYTRDLDDHPVEPEDFARLCRRRRSVRWYTNRPVDRELIDKAMHSAALAPSACNRQPFVFRIFDDPARAAQIADIPLGTGGFSQQVPNIAVIVGRLRAYPLSRDRHAIYIDGSLAAMSFMFALETRGIASCPINWPDQEPQESIMRAELDLDDDERVIMLVAFGWPDPDGKVPYSGKKSLDTLRSFE